jgi:hypothetical protein
MALTTDVDKILYKLGYYDADPHKKQEVEGYIAEAVEFMTASGVPAAKQTTQTAYAVKSIWADARDKGDDNAIVKKDGMIVSLISQMRR